MCEIAIIHSAIISNLLEYLMVLVSILILLSRIFIELVSKGVLERKQNTKKIVRARKVTIDEEMDDVINKANLKKLHEE